MTGNIALTYKKIQASIAILQLLELGDSLRFDQVNPANKFYSLYCRNSAEHRWLTIVFTTRRTQRMLARYRCNYVRPSVCLSVTRALCDKTKQSTADILIPHESSITLVF